jgi:NAD+ synthase
MKNPPMINPKLETKKIIKFLKTTFTEQKIDRVVLGLSGGIDSTVALFLLKKVLPLENIYAIQMDYKPRKNLDIDTKGIKVINFSIKNIVDNFKSSIPNFFITAGRVPAEPQKFDTEPVTKARLGNIMARVRMIILFDLAKQLNALVCGTENKSENLLGYFTRFGDQASDIEPISHLYKTQVRQLATYLKVPQQIINQSPTAGLWDGQTDEKDFGFSYEEADQVLVQFMDPRFHGDDTRNTNKLIKQLEKTFPSAEKIIKRFEDNQFKSQVPYSL